jgi:hypothetical protein
MTTTEDWVRENLRQLADDAQPAPVVERLLQRRAHWHRRRQVMLAAAAAVVTAATVAAAALVGHYSESLRPQPAQQPKVFHLPTQSSARPGAAQLVVTVNETTVQQYKPTYVVPAHGPAVRLTQPDPQAQVLERRLSPDGTVFLEGRTVRGSTELVVVDLTTGVRRRLPNGDGAYAEISPDGRTVALRGRTRLRLITLSTGRTRFLRGVTLSRQFGAQLGWSPDGTELAVENGRETVVVKVGTGRVTARLPGTGLAVGSLSWTPDGRSLVAYGQSPSGLVVAPVDGDATTAVVRPPGAQTVLGWQDDRLVWLVGDAGSQRLVTSTVSGQDVRPWLRFDVGARTVAGVSWSGLLHG